MGIVVCLSMLLGLVILQPTPWRKADRIEYPPKFVMFSAFALAVLGCWYAVYGFLFIDGFWRWASLVTGAVMLLASMYIFLERQTDARACTVRKIVVVLLMVSFALYAITIIQLNLGYPIVR